MKCSHQVQKSSRAVLSRLGETLRRDEAVELLRTNASYRFAFINERSEVRINIPTPAAHVAWAGKERGWYVGRKDGFLGPVFTMTMLVIGGRELSAISIFLQYST
jgi:hypothetical protein